MNINVGNQVTNPSKKSGERERTRESGNQVMVTLIKGELLSWGGGRRTKKVRLRVGW